MKGNVIVSAVELPDFRESSREWEALISRRQQHVAWEQTTPLGGNVQTTRAGRVGRRRFARACCRASEWDHLRKIIMYSDQFPNSIR